jgi:hypothetical protein
VTSNLGSLSETYAKFLLKIKTLEKCNMSWKNSGILQNSYAKNHSINKIIKRTLLVGIQGVSS